MVKERLKQTAFRLPDKTLEQLDELKEEGKVRSRTDGVIQAVDQFYLMEIHKEEMDRSRIAMYELVAKFPIFLELIKGNMSIEEVAAQIKKELKK